MNPVVHAVRTGLGRGWTEFKLSLRSPQDIWFYLFSAGGVVAYLFFNRNHEVEGTSLLLPALALPSILGAFVAFGAYIGPAYALSIEREDGTLLRAKAVPHGMVGYVSGQALFQALGVVPALVLILVPSWLLFGNLMHRGATGWLIVAGVLLLGLLAVLPLGAILGSLMKSPRQVGMWGMLPVLVLVAISGIFYPITALPAWVQTVAQVFPIYWLGLGMRSAFLPAEAASLEIGESWRTLETIGVLGAWAALGLVLAPIVLRRMARRESGSLMEARRHEAMQRIG